jgi:hypothetical protein
MLREAAVLLAHKIVFSDEAKNAEVKRRKFTYDIGTIISDKDKFE